MLHGKQAYYLGNKQTTLSEKKAFYLRTSILPVTWETSILPEQHAYYLRNKHTTWETRMLPEKQAYYLRNKHPTLVPNLLVLKTKSSCLWVGTILCQRENRYVPEEQWYCSKRTVKLFLKNSHYVPNKQFNLFLRTERPIFQIKQKLSVFLQ